MSVESQQSARDGQGIWPTLAELIALQGKVWRRVGLVMGTGAVQGQALSKQRGRGMEYADSREYTQGDDARYIDWRMTARTGKAHTKLFQAERERLTVLVVDTAAPLYFGTRYRYKSVQAARMGAVAMWQALREGDRVAALRAGQQDAWVAPGHGANAVLRILGALTRWYRQPPTDDQGVSLALQRVQRLVQQRARLIVLTDPRSVQKVPQRYWAGLAKQHAVTVVLFVDALEMQPPEAVLDFALENREVLRLPLQDDTVRTRWMQTFAGRLTQIKTQLASHGVEVVVQGNEDVDAAWLTQAGRPKGKGYASR